MSWRQCGQWTSALSGLVFHVFLQKGHWSLTVFPASGSHCLLRMKRRIPDRSVVEARIATYASLIVKPKNTSSSVHSVAQNVENGLEVKVSWDQTLQRTANSAVAPNARRRRLIAYPDFCFLRVLFIGDSGLLMRTCDLRGL